MSTYDPYFHKVVLLLSGGGPDGGTTFTDATGKTVSRYGDTKYSTLQSKFRSTSIAFDAAGDGLYVSGSEDFAFGTEDFTMEAWAYFTDLASRHNSIITRWPAQWSFLTYYDTLVFYPAANIYPAGSTIPANQWVHVAVTRNSGTIRLFVNGVKGAEYASLVNYVDTTTNVLIGTQDGTTNPLVNGYLEDVRITKGVARYVADFTPPDSPFYTRGAELLGTVVTSGELEDWEVVAYDAHSHQYVNKATVSYGEYKMGPMDPFKQYMLACRPRVDELWRPRWGFTAEPLITASDPVAVPYIFKLADRIGDNPLSGDYEPQWPMTVGATVSDGDFTWTNVGRLVRPQMHGPLIPR